MILPWLTGAVWVYLLVGRSGHWNTPLVLGHGFLAGMFFTTVILRCWDLMQFPFHFWSILGVLTVFSGIGLYLVCRSPAPTRTNVTTPMQPWQGAIVALLLLLIFGRYLFMAQELALKPLFAWDAWMNWVPKAIVWYHYNEIVPFVSPGDWLSQSAESTNYTLGNGRSWNYPHTVPLIQLWGMLAVGTSDHPLVFLPWLIIAPSAALSIYGHLRLSGSPVVLATAACYAFLNLPYVNVHSVLPGYADIWLAVAFGQACMALHAWRQSTHWSYACLALIMALICGTLKTPGLVLGGVILIVLGYCQLGLSRKQLLLAGPILVLLAAGIVLVGFRVDLPLLGTVALSSESIELPFIGHLKLLFHPVHAAIGESLFRMINWNMLWPIFFIAMGSALLFPGKSRAAYPVGLAILLAVLILVITFNFTKHFYSAENFTTLNRGILYIVPTIVFYVFLIITARITEGDGVPSFRYSRAGAPTSP